jgi:hypothetical protein
MSTTKDRGGSAGIPKFYQTLLYAPSVSVLCTSSLSLLHGGTSLYSFWTLPSLFANSLSRIALTRA